MTTTAPVARFLRRLPEPIAADLCDTITEACAHEPVSGPGIRCLLPSLAWRLESHGRRLVFGFVDGAPIVVTAQFLKDLPARRRRPSRTTASRGAN